MTRPPPPEVHKKARMTADQAVRRLRRLVDQARKAGLRVVVDANGPAVGVLTEAEYQANRHDLRGRGEFVTVDDACGGAAVRVSGDASNYG